MLLMKFHGQLQFLHYVFKVPRSMISKAGTHVCFGAETKEADYTKILESLGSTPFWKAVMTTELIITFQFAWWYSDD